MYRVELPCRLHRVSVRYKVVSIHALAIRLDLAFSLSFSLSLSLSLSLSCLSLNPSLYLLSIRSEVANSEEQSSAGLAAYRTLLDQSGTRISELSQECAELTSQLMSQCDDGAAGGALRSPHHHDESDQQQSQNIVLTELSEEVKRLRVKLVSLQGEYDSAADGERIAREQAASDATAAASRLRDALATTQACRDDSTVLREALRASEDRLVTANAHADEIAARLQCAEGEIVRLANELQEVTDTALSKVREEFFLWFLFVCLLCNCIYS